MTSPTEAGATAPAFHQLDIGIIGAGRVGPVLGNALRAAGHRVVGIAARSAASRDRAELLLPGVPILPSQQVAERSDFVLIAVNDDALPGLVAELADAGSWRSGQLVAHTAGRYGLAVLSPATSAGALGVALHPAMTFTGTSLDLARLPRCRYAVTASPLLVPLAEAVVAELEGTPVVIAEADRPAYHAALVHSANHLVTLIDDARRWLTAIGVTEPGDLLEPLTTAALTGALHGGADALTGPASRGDIGTIRAHLDALADLASSQPDLRDAPAHYAALAHQTVAAAARTERVGPERRAALDAAIDAGLTGQCDEAVR